eukprot:CAMPEP_0117444242 /NCGR_PEP_ID=MMETSP0759-20121206/5132_1 /TAXON_ID=63605 /ORGANISM="Percolomonas cosmopolitus, Strain WS" /LENGTH=187 /DNA_ID=CAMNT_0005236287 /DNA_START=54 /DNA_END=617 /DNA_ORIENTATION=+
MGLWTILKKMKQKEKEMRILMLGLDNAGKTTIVRKFNGEPTDTIAPTLGFNIKTFEIDNYTLNIFDVGGQKMLRSYWRNYFEETDGIVWVVDSADTIRLQQCKDELNKLLLEERLAGASLLIFANKQDLKSAKSKDEIAEVLGLGDPKHYKGRHFHVVACSAQTGEGLEEGIRWCVQDIASRIFMLD